MSEKGTTIVIEPHTRVEGHLRVEISLRGQQVIDAKIGGTMWRGIELILHGKTPKEAISIVQRICGVCPVAHAVASARAVENAYGFRLTPLSQKIRNLLLTLSTIHDHLIHFYVLSLPDWIDFEPLRALSEERLLALLRPYIKETALQERDLLRKFEFYLRGPLSFPFLAKGQTSHPDLLSDPEIAVRFLFHQLISLEIQRNINQILETFGGSTPHIISIIPGGVKFPPTGKQTSDSLPVTLKKVEETLREISHFLRHCYMADALLLAELYPRWGQMGNSYENFLVFPELPTDDVEIGFYHPGGLILSGEIWTRKLTPEGIANQLSEDLFHSWFREVPCFEGQACSQEVLPPEFVGEKYSFVLAPRILGKPAEVGSSASLKLWSILEDLSEVPLNFLKELLPIEDQLIGKFKPSSVTGRHLARAIKSLYYAEIAKKELKKIIEDVESGSISSLSTWEVDLPKGEYEGIGLAEAPRGALLHRVLLRDGKVMRYQVITPSGWNMSPRDRGGIPGPCEKALIGVEIRDPAFPLEVYRIVRSFDPCMACAVHCVILK